MTATLPLPDLTAEMRSVLPELGVDWQGAVAPAPSLLTLNAQLARDLGLDANALRSGVGVTMLAGSAAPTGAHPIAMGYAGHQFGGFSPRLGDGRALLLGEHRTPDGDVVDIHLKGSGRTPFARGGDGKATLGPMLREYLIAEAMHALGAPTGRALAVVTTGEDVMRQFGPEPGAVLTRVAASHLRVGTFEYAAQLEPPDLVKRLADYAIERHFPAVAAKTGTDRYLDFFSAVVEAQAALIAKWMSLGFIHGVMNTDNTTISGETIDYGPCAFLDAHDPAAVFSSIDRGGRYAFGNQPQIAMWNLARLAETLLPLIDDDHDQAAEVATERLQAFAVRFAAHHGDEMRAKLGLATHSSGDQSDQATELIDRLLELMAAHRCDHTQTFRSLADHLRGRPEPLDRMLSSTDARDRWLEDWQTLVGDDAQRSATADAMDAVNPIYIPRNHLVEAALSAAVDGNLEPFDELLALVTAPFDAQPGQDAYAEPAPVDFNDSFRTYCGT